MSKTMTTHLVFAISLVIIVLVLVGAYDTEENPCKARPIVGHSVVCVCDSDYCDEIIREKPTANHYVAYATSKEGLRFYKVKGPLQESFDGAFAVTTIEVNVTNQYQTIEGFGGAITDAAGINWMSINESRLRDHLINPKGLEYNVIRTPIGGCDCSKRKYALNELPKYDKLLSNFSLAHEDYTLKIPMFKAALKASKQDINVIGTTWSPPDWMKKSNNISVCGKLNPEYYQSYADYHIKFIEAYHKEGIDIWGITTTNEPMNSFLSTMVFNCLGWSSSEQATWIVNNLGPSIRASKFNNTMIFVNDDQRYAIPFLFNELVASNADVLKYINGVAVHGYADTIMPPSVLSSVTKPYPNLKLMVTEFCEGYLPYQNHKVELGSWERAESYIKSLFGNLNYGAVGYIDWNLCLDKIGGPNWALNFVDSPIIVFHETGEFVKQPTFYVMGHFSKFVPRGSKRVDVNIWKSAHDIDLQNVAFLTPENTVVVILYNPSDETRASIKLGSQAAVVMVPAESLVTLELVVDATSFEPASVNKGPEGTPDVQKSAVSTAPTSATDPMETKQSNQQKQNTTSPNSSPSNGSKKQSTPRGHSRNPSSQRQSSPQNRRSPPSRWPHNKQSRARQGSK